MFIVFEGVDAVGKTTVARLLANRLGGGTYYATPPSSFLAERERVDLSASPDDHYRFYLHGIHQASREIWALLASGKTVVGDRYWASTYVYHEVMGAAVAERDFDHIVLPDLTVLLSVTSEEQALRFEQRGMSAGDRRMFNDQVQLARAFRKFFTIRPTRLVAIDTTYLAPAEVVAQVVAEAIT